MKKFISMALALVMTLSLCTFVVTPEADAFEDTGSLPQYSQQAIDVIEAIEVMTGYEDNTFQPDSILTRQAAAKIICNMILGPITAKALPTTDSPFPDVNPGTEWAGYISYCSHEGIINGYSDGLFQPTGPLTGYAFLKMLLGALGYSVQAEGFTGSNWKVNVAKIALGIELNKGITDDPEGENLEKGVSREDAAIYAFNTLQADLVEYPSQNSININGVTVSMGNGKATPQTWNTSVTSIDNISASRSDGNNQRPIVQFAERYFDKLVRSPNGYHERHNEDGEVVEQVYGNGRDEYTTDDFGRPSVVWTWKGVDVGTYSRDPDAVFVGNVKVNAIYEALGMTSGNGSANLYINSGIPNNEFLNVARSNDKDLDHGNNLRMYTEDDMKRGADASGVRTINEARRARGLSEIPDVLDKNGRIIETPGDVLLTDIVPDGWSARDWATLNVNDRKNQMIGTSMNIFGDGAHRVDRIGDGTLIECFLNTANNHVDVCVISAYGGKVDSVKAATAKKDRYITLVYADDNQAAHRPDTITGTGNNEFETEDFAEEDYVAYTYSDSANSVKNVYLMSAESGSLNSRISEKSLNLDNTVYPYAKEYAFYEMTEDDLSSKSAYVVYSFSWQGVDKYKEWTNDAPLVLWVEEDEFAVDQYVLIERITIENSNGRYVSSLIDPTATAPADVQVVARTSSGARRTYNLDDSKNYRSSNAAAAAANNSTAIAVAFRAGHIVRLTSTNNGYRLHAVDAKYMFQVNNFTINGKDIAGNVVRNGVEAASSIIRTPTVDYTGQAMDGVEAQRLIVDSETHFTVQDATNDTYKAYTGTKNVPIVTGAGAVAYVYHRGALAKQIFITSTKNVTDVTSSSRDIVFLLVPSTSKLVKSDDGDYYEVTAIDKDVVKTLRIKAQQDGVNTFFEDETGSYFEPNNADLQYNTNEGNCLILNQLTYDSNDLVISGTFDSTKVDAHYATGIRRVNSSEVRMNTSNSAASSVLDVAGDVRVFFCDGDDIEQIDYDDIVNDTRDAIYYVINDDSFVTYIFIVNFEDDGVPHHATKPDDDTPPVVDTPVVDFDMDNVDAPYVVEFTSAHTTSAKAGETLTFRVRDTANGNAVMNNTQVTVSLSYTANAEVKPVEPAPAYNEETSVWSVTVPNDAEDGTPFVFDVSAIAA